MNMLGLVKRGRRHILQASKSEIHGDAELHLRPKIIGATSISLNHAPATPINLGNPHEISVRELAERIIDVS